MGKRGDRRASNLQPFPLQPHSLREEKTGMKQTNTTNVKSKLKLQHLQSLAVWECGEASVPSLAAFFGHCLAAANESLRLQQDPSLFSCQSLLGSLKFKRCNVRSHQTHPKNRNSARKIIRYRKQERFVDCASLVKALSRNKNPQLAQKLVHEMESQGVLPDNSTLCALMFCYANNGFVLEAQAVWEELLNSSFVLNVQVVSDLMDAYGRIGCFNEIIKLIDQVSSRKVDLLPEVYSRAIFCFGEKGQLELMEYALKEMVSRGFLVDSATGNAFIIYYSTFGSLTEMETVYGRLKRNRHLIDEEGIRAVSFAYLRERKFYSLGEFLRDVGLGRKDVGNLLWNLLLLSYAGNFKMKSLQREFMRMLETGFRPDLTTFNIRAVAFSRMSMFWDLHLSLEHMKHESVVPDLVTYGCVVDAYMDKRLGRNLDFAFSKMNLDDYPLVSTDPFVFEVLGKGDFHSSSEAFLEFKRWRKCTYRKLIAVYLKKQFRRNQIFWNY